MQKVPKNTCSIYYNVVMYIFFNGANTVICFTAVGSVKDATQIRIELSTEDCGCSVSVVLLQLMFHT